MMKVFLTLLLFFTSILSSRQEKPIESNDEFLFVEGNAFIQSFYISKYEVTIAEFMAFQKATGYKTVAERLDSGIVYNPRYKMVKGVTMRHDIYGDPLPEDLYEVTPASRIVLEDAQAYAKWKGGRIPTNEEWAYAAKGGKKSKGYRYPGGNNPNRIGYFDRDMKPEYPHPQPIGKKEPNELGL